MAMFGGSEKLMSCETGGDFWLALSGADKVGLHGDGGNVLRKSGDVMNYSDTDPIWAAAAFKTMP